MTAMHHEPVADRLGIRTHKLPANWRQRGGGGNSGGGGRSGTSGCLAWGAVLLLIVVVGAVLADCAGGAA